ncbi:DUF87 domain-containing protein (plasmid) [Ochrobactrum pseudogrignonense]|uniref:DUF87 domain-containing protein n=1 Tax=Brucella pseudogrignonensis TaxID=419475 RepID=A0A7Y3TA66_9HYPH|nr:DUF87 domain-containing protein [Brucella pseudogrignonensis]
MLSYQIVNCIATGSASVAWGLCNLVSLYACETDRHSQWFDRWPLAGSSRRCQIRTENKQNILRCRASICLTAGVSLPRETRHFNIIGAPGGGKTIIMSRMIHAAVERNDKVIIFDQKGDYTKIVPPNICRCHGL